MGMHATSAVRMFGGAVARYTQGASMSDECVYVTEGNNRSSTRDTPFPAIDLIFNTFKLGFENLMQQ